MYVAPEGLRKAVDFIDTGSPGVKKAVYGSSGPIYFEIGEHLEYNAAKSKAAKKEIYDAQEVVTFVPDRFSRVVKKFGKTDTEGNVIIASELSDLQQMEVSPHYERFKTQQDSPETLITNWAALSANEKVHLQNMGVWTVEQMMKLPEYDTFKLGPNRLDILERGRQHLETKRGPSQIADRKADMDMMRELKEEMAKIRAENEQLCLNKEVKRLTASKIKPKSGRKKIEIEQPTA